MIVEEPTSASPLAFFLVQANANAASLLFLLFFYRSFSMMLQFCATRQFRNSKRSCGDWVWIVDKVSGSSLAGIAALVCPMAQQAQAIAVPQSPYV
jgi:hypothetical protein